MMEAVVRREGDLDIKAGTISRAGRFVMSKCEKELVQSISRDCVVITLKTITRKNEHEMKLIRAWVKWLRDYKKGDDIVRRPGRKDHLDDNSLH